MKYMKTELFNKTYYINERKESARQDFSNILFKLIMDRQKEKEGLNGGQWRDLIFLCIGSDRVTGDSLGPMVGYQLSKNDLPGIWIYGTLEHPVHALNLEETMLYIESTHPNAIIIALDASLGSRRHQGYITVGKGCLMPGAGVQKELPAVGDIYVTGIINVAGSMEYLALQTTRLATIMRMADSISSGILLACQKYYLKRACASNPDLFTELDKRIYLDLKDESSLSEGTAISLKECAVGDGINGNSSSTVFSSSE